MRIWDIPQEKLCRQHLLGEHRELHAIWSVLTKGKRGYSRHPETMRWRGKLRALYLRHAVIVNEMERRGYKHQSVLDKRMASGRRSQTDFVNSRKEQLRILKDKKCGCRV